MYADDVLMADSGAVHVMLDVVEAYVSRWKMKFNSRKSKVMEGGVCWMIVKEIVEKEELK